MDNSEKKYTSKNVDYKNLTKLIYQELSWLPLYIKQDGKVIRNADNNAEKYILDSLKIMKLKPKDLKNKKVFNIGTGRESRFFASHGADVTHIDIGPESVSELKNWSKKNKLKVNTNQIDIADAEIGANRFDIIFLSGIYQHIKYPALALVKFINALKKNGLMYMGFYRSGEFKYFIVDAIRHILPLKYMSKVRDINSILFTLGEHNHYQSSRVMDDFYVPRKHNFHPKDVISDIKLLGGDVFYFDNDFRDYDHKGHSYFSVGGDRIYITKKSNKISSLNKVKNKLKTLEGKNQIFEVKYKEDIINENIEMIKKIKTYFETGFVDETNIICLSIGLYQFTRPFEFENSYYFQLTKKKNRHEVLNLYLKNFIKNFSIKR
jgi:SAM-dependent methyltransferase